MKAWIFEDEPRAVRRLTRLLAEVDATIQVQEVADSVGDAIRLLDKDQPDLLLCDIQLADGLSFDIFKAHPPDFPIIFTTAFDQYALDAFRNGGVEYLLKPIDQGQLERALVRARKLAGAVPTPTFDPELLNALLGRRQSEFRGRFLVQFGNKLRSIDAADVVCFYSETKSTLLRTAEREYVIDNTLEELEAQLDPARFFRANRGLLVARDRTKDFKSWLGG